MKLSKKLRLSFVFSIILSILIISLISNYMINNRFENYLVREREDTFERIHQDINNLYLNAGFQFYEMELKHIALAENINIIIKNNENEVLYNSNTRMGMRMDMGIHHGMMNRRRTSTGNYVEKTYPLKNGSDNLGYLIIGFIDNSHLTNSALIFKNTLAQSFIVSGLITVFIGFIISILLSKSLTEPLISIRDTANNIRNGDLSSRSMVKTNTKEILELSNSINYLGNTLALQEKIRKRYAMDISHELRTPLTTLKTHLEAIMDGVWEATPEHLDILMKEISRLTNLVDDLRDSFKQEEYSMTINKTKFNISRELEDIITTFVPLYKKVSYEINYDIEKDMEVIMDKDKFKQIMNNLLSNSLRYLNDNGKVFIKLRKDSKSIIISVKDNGIGIKKDDLINIFERFYRVDTSRNKTTGGTGLGLSIVKSIVDAHNGEIDIKSEYGLGTEIILKFPL